MLFRSHEKAAQIADEMGLLLWEEIPVYWAIEFENPDSYQDAENQLQELIRRDRNRASVIIWGVGNENADTDQRLSFMGRLAKCAHKLDPSRLVSAACLINREKFAIEDRLADFLDVIGINEYFGWYEADMSLLERLLANSRPGKPVVISESGGDALAGYRGSVEELFTEDKQAAIHQHRVQADEIHRVRAVAVQRDHRGQQALGTRVCERMCEWHGRSIEGAGS